LNLKALNQAKHEWHMRTEHMHKHERQCISVRENIGKDTPVMVSSR